MKRKTSAELQGTLKEGKGIISTESGVQRRSTPTGRDPVRCGSQRYRPICMVIRGWLDLHHTMTLCV